MVVSLCLFLSSQVDTTSIGIDHDYRSVIAKKIDYLDTDNVLSVDEAAGIPNYNKDSNVKPMSLNIGIKQSEFQGPKEPSSNCIDKTACQKACENNFGKEKRQNKCKKACNGEQVNRGKPSSGVKDTVPSINTPAISSLL